MFGLDQRGVQEVQGLDADHAQPHLTHERAVHPADPLIADGVNQAGVEPHVRFDDVERSARLHRSDVAVGLQGPFRHVPGAGEPAEHFAFK